MAPAIARGYSTGYLWADGVYVKAGLEKDKAALLVVVAGLEDGRTMVVAVEASHRESRASWRSLLPSLRDRGMTPARLMVADGHLGIWSALARARSGVSRSRYVWPRLEIATERLVVVPDRFLQTCRLRPSSIRRMARWKCRRGCP